MTQWQPAPWHLASSRYSQSWGPPCPDLGGHMLEGDRGVDSDGWGGLTWGEALRPADWKWGSCGGYVSVDFGSDEEGVIWFGLQRRRGQGPLSVAV